MKKKILLISIILILLTTPLITAIKIKQPYDKKYDINNLLEGGWLEEKDSFKILHISGSHYEMGYQYGYYLKDSHLTCRRIWLNYIKQEGCSIADLKDTWNVSKEYIPDVYKQEIQGRADALGLDFIDEAILSVFLTYHNNNQRCFGFAAWGNATLDGKLYHAHSNDWSLETESLRDVISNTYAYQHQVLIVRKPANGYSSISIGTTGGIEAEAGMNENGICITFNTGLHFTNDSTSKGIPTGVRNLMVLDNAKSSQEAIDIMTSNRTTGWNYIISDGNENKAYILEQTANFSYVGSWNDTIEDNYPSYKIEDLVRRGNIFINYEAPGINHEFYKKSTFLKLILNILHINNEKNLYFFIKRFKIGSDELNKKHGTLNLNNSIKLLRRVYNGNTNLFCFLLTRVIPILYVDTWDQKVFCPETGDIAISFAKNGKTAYRTSIHYFNMYELFNSKPC